MEDLNTQLIAKSLGYHGLPLQKAWEEEYGASDLKKMGLVNLDYSIYFARQKNLTFSDRAKRMRLHQFMCKKADNLFNTNSIEALSKRIYKERPLAGAYATVPPFDYFYKLNIDARTTHFYDLLQEGDVIYATVTTRTSQGILCKVLCSTGSGSRYTADLNVKAMISSNNAVNAVDKKGITRNYSSNDYICCEVLDVYPDSKKINCGMRGHHPRFDNGPSFGLITIEEFPPFYKTYTERPGESFNSLLEESEAFGNPSCVDNLMRDCGLNIKEPCSNMSSLKGKYPSDEYASELRQAQASKWAVRSVAEGIEHFKEGRHTEAFQCLNKALSIDPKNVEGLVARGALCANSGYFKKAVADFEDALKLNPNHVNARKYLCETLVALGRNYEDESKIEDAKKAYLDCLKINPHHEEAQSSLDHLKAKSNVKQIVEPAELEMPLNIGGPSHRDDYSKKEDLSKKDKKAKKDKKKRNKKRHSSSSESSSESSDSSDSSSESSTSTNSSSTSDSEPNSRSKKKDKKEKVHQKSLSPLSKRMGELQNSRDTGNYQGYEANLQGDDYETKVRKFLSYPNDEEDYEEKVRLLLAETSRYQKAKLQEEKAKKKKKKEDRKLKKDSKKKKKKDDKKKSKNKKEKLDLENVEGKKLRDALKLLESFPNALSELYGKGDERATEKEEDKPVKSKDQDHSHSMYDKEDDFTGGKWKMMFSKDERQNEQMSKNKQPKQYAFGYDSEDDEVQRSAQIQASSSSQMQASTSSSYGGGVGSSGMSFEKSSKKRHLTPPKLKEAPPSAVKSGPVVLDKFGNFRLATTDPIKPPEPHSRRSRSRSRKKYDSSSSRSKSRSPRRRSHSGSYPRRKYSRSRSHSYGDRRRSASRSRSRSYSRSRSRSSDRRRFGKGYRGRGGSAAYNDRGTYYKPRFNTNVRGRGRGSNGNFRDNRDFRGRGRYDRTPYRPRARGNGNRHFERYRDDDRPYRRYSRSRSFSVERPRSPAEDRHYSDHERDTVKDSKKAPQSPPLPGDPEIEGRWADDKRHDERDREHSMEHTGEDYDKIVDKARKEKKEELKSLKTQKSTTGW